VKAGATATPVAPVCTVDDPAKVPLAPLPGGCEVTFTPETGLLLESVTLACKAVSESRVDGGALRRSGESHDGAGPARGIRQVEIGRRGNAGGSGCYRVAARDRIGRERRRGGYALRVGCRVLTGWNVPLAPVCGGAVNETVARRYRVAEAVFDSSLKRCGELRTNHRGFAECRLSR